MKRFWSTVIVMITSSTSFAQSPHALPALKKYLSKDSSSYIQANVVGQFWGRYTHHNPGSTFNNENIDHSFDMAIRRIRFSTTAEINNRFLFYGQFGLNNLSTYNSRKQGMFIHDAVLEAKLYKRYLEVGFGLSGWSGTSRYASSSINTILGLDLPLIQETTNDFTDQFGRKFGIYAKGKISKLDYRFAFTQPFLTRTANANVETLAQVENDRAVFSVKNPKFNYAGYFQWQFLDQESNQMPYNRGSYLGQKRVLNIGTGFQYQKDAMWYRNNQLDTISTPLFQYGLDVFYDYAFNKEKQNALTIYGAFLYYNLGPNYVRNVGVLNFANGGSNLPFNGAGNGAPLVGTGLAGYFQVGYKFRNNLLGEKCGTLQPYAIYNIGDYDRLSSKVHIYHVGLNWLVIDQNIKLSLDYQDRPIFKNGQGSQIEASGLRRGMLTFQAQFSI